MKKQRCTWVGDNALMIDYHDTEWGVPVHDDRKLFEFMVLDAMQAGLSWQIVLNKRAKFNEAMHAFDYRIIAEYTEKDIERLLNTDGIIRNRQKLNASVTNAKKVLEIKKEFGSFDNYLWGFVDGSPVINAWQNDADIPAKTQEAERMSQDLSRRGFKFVGPTICYAFMQGAGMVNDHLASCFRYREVIHEVK